jgi:hypothetical protein
LSKLFNFSEDVDLQIVDDQTMYKLLEEMSGCSTPSNFYTQSTNIISKFQKMNPNYYIRGKYERWFIIQLLIKFIILFSHSVLSNEDKLKIHTQINCANALISWTKSENYLLFRYILKYNLI